VERKWGGGEMRPIYRNKHHMTCHMIEDKY
jgi:hypothetical protein